MKKGFYFSLDALLASAVLLSAVTMLMTFDPGPENFSQPAELTNLRAAAFQDVQDWNSTRNSTRTVLEKIYMENYEGGAEDLCNSYFSFEEDYALYLSNSTDSDRICGELDPNEDDNLATYHVLVPDIPANSQFRGPRVSTLVMRN